jgi:nucleoredoxin
MRLFLAGIALLAFASVGLTSTPAPMTLKEVSLMLRSGYSSAAVEREVAARHFIGPIDANGEKNLLEAGASPALVTGLKSGLFAIPASELAGVKSDLAAKEARRAAELEESRKLNTLYQAQQAEKRRAAPPAPPTTATGIASLVKGILVTSRNGVLRTHLDDEFQKKKLIGLYFSASWCGPCRKFTPKLVAYYNSIVPAHPEFEILFVSADKTPAAMEAYMRDFQMPWPALSFDKMVGNEALRKYAGSGIPCLVVVDENGRVMFDTFSGTNFRGPEAVLADLDKFFAAKGPAQIAQAR